MDLNEYRALEEAAQTAHQDLMDSLDEAIAACNKIIEERGL